MVRLQHRHRRPEDARKRPSDSSSRQARRSAARSTIAPRSRPSRRWPCRESPTGRAWTSLEDGKLRTLAVEHVDERKVELALELSRRYPEDPDAGQGPPHVLRTGESELIAEITEERLAELAVDDLHLGLVRELGFQSYMGVPLVARDAGSRRDLLRRRRSPGAATARTTLLSPKSSPAAPASPSKTRSCTARSKSARRRRACSRRSATACSSSIWTESSASGTARPSRSRSSRAPRSSAEKCR